MADGNSHIGIDAMVLYTPHDILQLSSLVESRYAGDQKRISSEKAKLRFGVGQESMVVPKSREDSVTMACNAVLELFKIPNIDRDNLDAVYIGTETPADIAIDIGKFLHQLVRLPDKAYSQEGKNACLACTDALFNAVNAIGNGEIDTALVIGTDIARYPRGTSGEPTQGAGAVAMYIKRNPRMLRLEKVDFDGAGRIPTGTFSGRSPDYWIPIGGGHAKVKANYSVISNSTMQTKAFDRYTNNLIKYGVIKPTGAQIPSDFFLTHVFHTPYKGMAKKNMVGIIINQLLSNRDRLSLELGRRQDLSELLHSADNALTLENILGELPAKDKEKFKAIAIENEPKLKAHILAGMDMLSKIDIKRLRLGGISDDEVLRINYIVKDFLNEKYFEELTAFPSKAGNLYTASWPASLYTFLKNIYGRYGDGIIGKRISIGSYGSGAGAKAFGMIVCDGIGTLLTNKNNSFEDISIREYESRKYDSSPSSDKITYAIVERVANAFTLKQKFCTHEGCGRIFSDVSGLEMCPEEGHTGFRTKYFPTAVTVKRNLDDRGDIVQTLISNDGMVVPIVGGPYKIGTCLEAVAALLKRTDDGYPEYGFLYKKRK